MPEVGFGYVDKCLANYPFGCSGTDCSCSCHQTAQQHEQDAAGIPRDEGEPMTETQQTSDVEAMAREAKREVLLAAADAWPERGMTRAEAQAWLQGYAARYATEATQ